MHRLVFLAMMIYEIDAICSQEEYLQNNACIRCKQCIRKQIITRECTSTSNRICECPPGTYYNLMKITCDYCSICGEGYKMVSTCSLNTDTKCIKCPRGYTSSGNNTLFCKKDNIGKTGSGEQRKSSYWVWILSLWFLVTFQL